MTHREKFTAERLKFKPKPEKKWNHQDELTSLVGKKIQLQLDPGSVVMTSTLVGVAAGITGTLIAADQFSLKLEIVSQNGKNTSVMTYFKHSIISFQLGEF